MKRWCVVDLMWLDTGGNGGRAAGALPEADRPKWFYRDRADAERAVIRLKRRHPGGRFYIFAAVGQVVDSAVRPGAWHIEAL